MRAIPTMLSMASADDISARTGCVRAILALAACMFRIKPRTATNGHRLLHLQHGDGETVIDGRSEQLAAPCLLLLPSLVVHGTVFAQSKAWW